MKIISDLPDNIVNGIRKLVTEGHYKSISEFILTSTENQLTLESGEVDNVLDLSNKNSANNLQKINGEFPIPTSEIPALDFIPIKKGKEKWDQWIWGQINRLLPIKFGVRFLAIESSKSGIFPEKKIFNRVVSEEARKFGLLLKKIDTDLKKARDKKLSSGFPIGEKTENSLDRYWSQFIGYKKKESGTLTGALFDLAFANLFIDDKGITRIGLNPEGIKFAQLQNPILDKNNFSFSLSEEERIFYFEHIRSHIPGEVSLFKILLGFLESGIDRRKKIDVELRKQVIGSNWSEGLISTQRAGAISRMYELGLVSKQHLGIEVRYRITELGRKWLGNW